MKQWVTSGSWTCMFLQILPETFNLLILFCNSWQNDKKKKKKHWLPPVFWFQCDSNITLDFRHLARIQFSSVQLLSRVQFFAAPRITARQTSLSITNSRSSLKLMSIELVMPSSHLMLCPPLLLLTPNPSQHQSIFPWVNSSHEVAKVLEFQL